MVETLEADPAPDARISTGFPGVEAPPLHLRDRLICGAESEDDGAVLLTDRGEPHARALRDLRPLVELSLPEGGAARAEEVLHLDRDPTLRPEGLGPQFHPRERGRDAADGRLDLPRGREGPPGELLGGLEVVRAELPPRLLEDLRSGLQDEELERAPVHDRVRLDQLP